MICIKSSGKIPHRTASGRRIVAAFALAVAAVLLTALAPAGPARAQAVAAAAGVPQSLPAVPLQAGLYIIQAEVARTPLERQIGLMHRPSLPINRGMLFVFEVPAVQCFWMKDTLVPLSAAFLQDDGTIVNIVDMQPRSEQSHCSARPVRYVLEMNQGWFAKRGFKAGSRIAGPPLGAR